MDEKWTSGKVKGCEIIVVQKENEKNNKYKKDKVIHKSYQECG